MATEDPTNPRTAESHSFTPRAVKIRNHLFNRMTWDPLVDVTLAGETDEELFIRLEIDLKPASDYALAIPEDIMERLGVDAEITTIKTGSVGQSGADPAFLCRVTYESTDITNIEQQHSLASLDPGAVASEFNTVAGPSGSADSNQTDSK